MKGLKNLSRRFEAIMTAGAFAEEGEFETAREIMRGEMRPQETIRKRPEQDRSPRLAARSK